MTSKKFTFAPESTPLAGFTIKRGIQRGGFGEVYYAISDGGKEVALKLLHSHVEVERRGTELCLNLKHPNLVSIIDIKYDEDGDTWIVMEYVSGATLDQAREIYRTASGRRRTGFQRMRPEQWATSDVSKDDYLA